MDAYVEVDPIDTEAFKRVCDRARKAAIRYAKAPERRTTRKAARSGRARKEPHP
jgi:hypothetical protein